LNKQKQKSEVIVLILNDEISYFLALSVCVFFVWYNSCFVKKAIVGNVEKLRTRGMKTPKKNKSNKRESLNNNFVAPNTIQNDHKKK
jgi:hypothetical protein